MLNSMSKWLIEKGIAEQLAPHFATGILIFAVIIFSSIADLITKRYILHLISHYIKKSKTNWDDVLLEKKVFERLSHIAPALVVHMSAAAFPNYQDWIQRLAFSYMILVGIYVFDSLLDAVNDIYRKYEVSKERPIKGYLQVIQILVIIMGAIVIIAILMNRSPLLLLSGIGAMTAVVSLIFKDSILGLVASIQMAANNMVRLGDWISMPQYGADGDVIDVTLNTVKIRNWDKTITTIPTYAFTSESFKNWRGMQESGGRRIKRAVYIDMTSIQFCTEEMLERYKKIQYISQYIEMKKKEIEEHNEKNHVDTSVLVNGRHLTNIGTFRAYIERYLKNHSRIHQDLTLLVRQLEPTENGLPIEIYAFTNDTAWVNYESIQADIFDHILAVVPEFDLRIFQCPSGYDLRSAVLGTNNPGNVEK